MYVYMYVCIYVYIYMGIWMGVYMDGWMDTSIYSLRGKASVCVQRGHLQGSSVSPSIKWV